MGIKLKAIKIHQPIGTFYLCMIDSYTLVRLSKVDRLMISNEDSRFEGIQRELNKSKITQIVEYLKSPEATFPNSIILNVRDEYIIGMGEDYIEIADAPDAFTIIDGQHRLEGLKKANAKSFELAVSIFVGLDLAKQSRLFVTINSEQTKVNPSVSLYQELYDVCNTPRKMVVEVALMFHYQNESPWYNQIKLLGSKDEGSVNAIISLSSFAKPIIDLIYNDEQYHELRNLIYNEMTNSDLNYVNPAITITKVDFNVIKKRELWEIYLEQNTKALYRILYNYFKVIQFYLPSDWSNEKGLLRKTTGYNAMIRLFRRLYVIGFDQGNLDHEFFSQRLQGIHELNGKINSDNYDSSGEKASRDLFIKFCDKIGIPHNQNS